MLPITQQDDQMWVNARSLHQALSVGRMFAHWIAQRLEAVGAIEGEDYAVLDGLPLLASKPGGSNRRDYLLSLDLGKEVAMLEKNETGKAIRRYFIDAEKELRQRPVLDMTDPLVLAQRFIEAETQRRVLSDENVKLRQESVVAAPKVESFDVYIGTEGLHSCNTAAKLVGWGRNKMLKELRRREILMSGGDSQNVPYQRFIDEGYFKVKVRSWGSPAGEGVDTTTFVTPRGIEYLHRLIGKPGRPKAASPPRPIQRGQLSKRESAPLFAHQLQDQE